MRFIPKEEKFYDLFEELINKIEEGGNLFLEMVEIALAESWKPLRKSNAKATMIRKITNPKESGMLQDDTFYYV